jgi:PIN domain nuclease of toxin-antitoxin system
LRLLLDTHLALWAISDHSRLIQAARNLISDPTNEIFVSAVTVWEIAIKHGLARLGHGRMPLSGAKALDHFRQAGYGMLAVSPEHAVGVESLPSIHADPFDRLLVAQALAEPLRLITHDKVLGSYSDSVIVV